VVVNAAGPWIDSVRRLEDPTASPSVRLSKGVHVVLEPERPWTAALTIPHDKVRVSFAVPWEGMLLLGTTDTEHDGEPESARVTDGDVQQVLDEAALAVDGLGPPRASFVGLRVLPGGHGETASAKRETVFSTGPSGMVSVAGGNVTPTPVALGGTGLAPTYLATMAANPLAFPDTMTGATGAAQSLTLTNTGNSALSGLSFTFGAGAPQPFARATAVQGGAGSCGTTLAVGASCTFNVVFAPTTVASFSRILTVTGNNGLKVTPASVTLTGAGVAARPPTAISPSPLTITLPSGNLNVTGTGVVTLKNSAPAGGSQAVVTGVAVSGGSATTYFFNVVAGSDNCTGATLAPGASCTVAVRFTNVGSPRGATRNGAITFTDTGAGSPQSRPLRGYATP